MCENITGKYLDIKRISDIKKRLLKNPENPKLVIIPVKLPDNRIINIVQDGVLIAGTKQRVAKIFFNELLKNESHIKTVVYTGQANGFGPVATAYGAYKLGLNSEIFLAGSKEEVNSRQITTLQALGAKITVCPTWGEAKQCMYNTVQPNWKLKPGYYIVPMGLNIGNMTDLLSKQIIKASKGTSINNVKNPRIWLVAGSGGIAMSLAKAFPNAHLFIYLTGHGKYKQSVINWAKMNSKVTIIKPMLEKNEIKLREDRHL